MWAINQNNTDPAHRRRRWRSVLAIGLLAGLGLAVAGCGGQSAQDEETAKQQKALKDPFGYSPDPNKADETVSGNGSFDKQGLKRDLDHVLNP